MKHCDIIVPIYNAYESVVECLESIVLGTDLNKNSLIIIDDKSTDDRIVKYINKFVKNNSDKNIEFLCNENNLGFVKTVNRGMKHSSNDVLLLNSDTVVSINWLEKIKKCAYSAENVATVTPFSNNATLVSVPICLQRNEIDDIDIKEYNDILEKLSTHDYPELPTAHGFCMFIKRSVLDEIGYFDEESYGRGYGEETDFSYRCLDFGYRHLLCDDTIVYHKESQSFSSERDKVIEEHMKILKDKYPLYCDRTDRWLKYLPIKNYAEKIYYSLKLNNGLSNVLILIHNWETKTGGTTLHVRDLIQSLNDKYNFFVLSVHPDFDNYVLYSVINGEEHKIILNNVFRYSDYAFYNSNYKKLLETIIDDFNISAIHVHHMQNHYFDVVSVAEEKKIKKIITLHDFYSLCPTINMLECGGQFCIEKSDKKCSECLLKLKGLKNDIVDNWQHNFHKLLKKFDRIITPSEDAKQYILKFYKDLDIQVIEHGLEMKKSSYRPNIDKNNFNVAMIGVLCNHKGGNIFYELINSSKENIHFHSFGYSEIKSLSKNRKNYTYHGLYKREELPKLLAQNDIDLICFLQKWPETYSYTLNEAIASGIPVLSFDIGAGAERIKRHGFGWTIPLNYSMKDLSDKIMDIFNDKEDFKKVLNKIDEYKIKTINEMGAEYDAFYKNDLNKTDYVFSNIDNIIFSNSNEIEELQDILNSTKWKLINKIKFSESFVNFVRKVLKKR